MSVNMKLYTLCLALLGQQIDISSAFLSSHTDGLQSAYLVADSQRHGFPTARFAAPDDSREDESNDTDEAEGLGFTALPAIGASSFWERDDDERTNANDNTNESSGFAWPDETNTKNNNIIVSEHTNLVSKKFKIQYTCKVCDTRNSHSVSRIAYRNGVVIAMCKGCQSKHLLADNLGWSNYVGGFDFDGGETDIEKYMENRDQEAKENGIGEGGDDLVMRVDQDVFDLETMLYKDRQENVSSSKDTKEGDKVQDETSWS